MQIKNYFITKCKILEVKFWANQKGGEIVVECNIKKNGESQIGKEFLKTSNFKLAQLANKLSKVNATVDLVCEIVFDTTTSFKAVEKANTSIPFKYIMPQRYVLGIDLHNEDRTKGIKAIFDHMTLSKVLQENPDVLKDAVEEQKQIEEDNWLDKMLK